MADMLVLFTIIGFMGFLFKNKIKRFIALFVYGNPDKEFDDNHLMTHSLYIVSEETPYAYKLNDYSMYKNVHTGQYIIKLDRVGAVWHQKYLRYNNADHIRDFPADVHGLGYMELYRNPPTINEYFSNPT